MRFSTYLDKPRFHFEDIPQDAMVTKSQYSNESSFAHRINLSPQPKSSEQIRRKS